MKKTGFFVKLIFIIVTIVSVSGCNMGKGEVLTGPLPPVPSECIKVANLLDKALYGAYELAQVSKLQVTRAANKFDECLQNAGLSRAESKAIIKDRVKSFKERPGAGDVKGSEDMFVF